MGDEFGVDDLEGDGRVRYGRSTTSGDHEDVGFVDSVRCKEFVERVEDGADIGKKGLFPNAPVLALLRLVGLADRVSLECALVCEEEVGMVVLEANTIL